MAAQKQCEQALEQHEQRLILLKNVVGLGIVPLEERSDGARTSDLAVAVYVVKKLPLEELAPKEVIPPMLEVRRGKRVDKVRTRVIEQGEVVLESLEPLVE